MPTTKTAAASDRMHIIAAPRANPFASVTTVDALRTELFAAFARIDDLDIAQAHKDSQKAYAAGMVAERMAELTSK